MKKNTLPIIIILAILLGAGVFFISNQNNVQDTASDQKKIGFIYIGPPGDHGWTYMHDKGRQIKPLSSGAIAKRLTDALLAF